MIFSSEHTGREQDIVDLFRQTFTESEGEEEGGIIGDLAESLIETTPTDDTVVCIVLEGETLVGCIVFTRLVFEQDDRVVYLLSPVAVHPDYQGQGFGQRLLRFGLDQMRSRGVKAVMTYGDPKYYGKVGFAAMSEDFAQAPQKLSYPHGWLGQSLCGQNFDAFRGPSQCVAALNDPAFW